MRIGVNTLFLVPGDVGGTEVYLRENLKEMIPANPGETFVLFTTRDNEGVLRSDLQGYLNVEYIQLPIIARIRPIRIIVEQTLLPWFVKRNRADILWSPGYTAPLVCPCRQAVTIHDLQYKTHPYDLSFLERVTTDFLVKNACRRCESIIAVSEFSRDEIVRFNFAGREKINVVYEGVDPTFGDSQELNISEFIPVPEKTPFILCVAHTYPHKQVHLLIEAFGRIQGEIPHHLVLVGKPRRGEDEVKMTLGKLFDRTKVHRLSELKYYQLKALYSGADLFVLPSEYEGFGLPVLEALIAGLPVVITREASLPEVGGTYATYVNRASAESIALAIKDVISWNPEKRLDIEINGRIWARSFSWEKSALETIKVLEKTTHK